MIIRKKVILALLYLSGSKILNNLKEIKELSTLSYQEVKEYQELKLKELLNYSFCNVPYYAEILKDTGVIVGGDVFLEQFSEIPFLTKEIMRREGDALYSNQKRKGVYENTSGGSTGEPVRFLQDRYYDDWNNATKIFYKYNKNQDIGDKELRLWGSERDILEGREKLTIRLRNWLYNRKELNAFRMSEKDMEKFVMVWNKFKPRWIEAYVQSIFEFGKFIKERQLSIHSPKGILCSAGTLFPEMKKLIEEVFSCQVYNRYGSREVGGIACTDNTGKGLKVSFWHNYVEVIDGRVYITTLNNKAMPLIRYDIGDVAETGDKPGYLNAIMGRINSIIRTPQGVIDSTALTTTFYAFRSINKYQLIQNTYRSFVLKIVVSDAELWKKEKAELKTNLLRILGDDVNIEMQEKPKIKPFKSGKFQYIISEVK